jgi:hypothetical protein
MKFVTKYIKDNAKNNVNSLAWNTLFFLNIWFIFTESNDNITNTVTII